MVAACVRIAQARIAYGFLTMRVGGCILKIEELTDAYSEGGWMSLTLTKAYIGAVFFFVKLFGTRDKSEKNARETRKNAHEKKTEKSP